MSVGVTKTESSTLQKQAVLRVPYFSARQPYYALIEPLKKRVFRGGGILGEESLPKWQTENEGKI